MGPLHQGTYLHNTGQEAIAIKADTIMTIIKRGTDLRLPNSSIAYLVSMEEEQVRKIKQDQGIHNYPGKASKQPTSYYISRLRQGHTVAEIAADLEVSQQAIYKLFKARGISPLAIQNLDEEMSPDES